ncbi:hypothetical protein SAMN06295888_1428 [Desulfonatronum zhilinae]|nr:hypothetical protein SAMN06295888_1428 [Desulfonatronum zhilinae]
MPVITIDGKEYDSETLSEEAKQQLAAIQYIDRKLAELNSEAAILQTARISYSNELKKTLPKEETSVQ